MTEAELVQILTRGEDSRHQFKREAHNADSIAASQHGRIWVKNGSDKAFSRAVTTMNDNRIRAAVRKALMTAGAEFQ